MYRKCWLEICNANYISVFTPLPVGSTRCQLIAFTEEMFLIVAKMITQFSLFSGIHLFLQLWTITQSTSNFSHSRMLQQSEFPPGILVSCLMGLCNMLLLLCWTQIHLIIILTSFYFYQKHLFLISGAILFLSIMTLWTPFLIIILIVTWTLTF